MVDEPTIFERARAIRAAIRAEQNRRAGEQAIKMQVQALGRLDKAVLEFESAVRAVREAKREGLSVSPDASVPPKVKVDDPSSFFTGNQLPTLEEALAAAAAKIDRSVDTAFAEAVVELDAHPAGEHELQVLTELELEVAEAALDALSEASERWREVVEKPEHPDLAAARRVKQELDAAWSDLENSGVSERHVQLLRRLSGDCVPLTTVELDDIAWLFEVGFASTLRLCSNTRVR